MKFNIDDIKSRAAGRWKEIIVAVASISEEFLENRHGPCPIHGGKDKWRPFRDFAQTGGCVCNDCGKMGDGLETIQKLTGKTFGDAIHEVAQFLGIEASSAKRERFDGSKLLELLEVSDPIRDMAFANWCLVKKPIKPAALITVGARLGRLKFYDQVFPVIAIPVWGPKLGDDSPVGWVLYHQTGQMLPSGDKNKPQWSKTRMSFKCGRGFVCDPDRFKSATHVIKNEGSTDCLATLSWEGLPGEVAPFTTVNGSEETPLPWMIESIAGKHVIVCHDNDAIGIKGSEKWAKALAQKAASLGEIRLPFQPGSKGKDLRDWIHDGGTWERFKNEKLIEHECGSELPEEDEVPVDDVDDPYRLAKINIQKYTESYGGRVIYWKSEWWRYKEGLYKRISDTEFRAKVSLSIRNEFERCWKIENKRYLAWCQSNDYEESKDKGPPKVKKVTRNLVNNVIGATEGLCVISSSISMPCWLPTRENKHYLSMKNGILDLEKVFQGADESECLLPHSPDWFSSCRLEYDFNPNATCPKWMDYLEYVMEGDQERISILQEWAGYLLTIGNDFQSFLILEGEGKNGKTVYFAAINAMLGEENVSHVSIEQFADRFNLASTVGKMANISGDADHMDTIAEGVLKKYTGGDAFEFDRKNREPIKARPTAKLMFAWNNRPVIKDRTQGMWRRMIIVPFKREVEKEKRVLGMDTLDWWIKSGETSGILNWAIIGLARLRTQNGFTVPRVSHEALEEYKLSSNPCAEFLDDHIILDEKGSIQSSELYKWYSLWSKSTGHKACSDRTFGREIRRKFNQVVRRRVRDGNTLYWSYFGINFCTDEICGEKINF